jgi:predicted  nucleic acid-binding Zn-ribbon protein
MTPPKNREGQNPHQVGSTPVDSVSGREEKKLKRLRDVKENMDNATRQVGEAEDDISRAAKRRKEASYLLDELKEECAKIYATTYSEVRNAEI